MVVVLFWYHTVPGVHKLRLKPVLEWAMVEISTLELNFFLAQSHPTKAHSKGALGPRWGGGDCTWVENKGTRRA